MLLLDLLPMDGFIHPMPPVLTGTPWLAIHVPITMISYSVFAIGVLIAHAQIIVDLVRPANRDLVRKLNELLYLYIHIGSRARSGRPLPGGGTGDGIPRRSGH